MSESSALATSRTDGTSIDPVIIVGNGPVGQTAALLLTRWGIPTVVLDKRPARDKVGSKAICQQRDVLDIWAAVGAGEKIADEGVTWSRARTFYRDHEVLSLNLTDRGQSPFPPFVNISQSRTEEILDEQIAGQPLIDERWGHEVVAMVQDDGGVTVTCRRSDGEVTLRAPYVISCGGSRTDLRKMMGVTFPGRSFSDQFLICDIRAELPGWEQERRFYFDPEWNPGRQVLIHPCPDSTFRIDWQVPPDFDLEEDERSGRLDQRVRQIIGDRPYEIVWRSVYRFHERCASRFRVGRVFYAGDCAHIVAPFGARGLNSGVPDVENLAWKLAFVVRGWAPDALLETYHDERYAAAQENLDVTSRTMEFLVPHNAQEWERRRSILERAVSDPEAKAEVDSGRLAEPFWYVDSPLTTPDPRRPFPGRPPRDEPPAVVPGVLVPDVPVAVGEATRLRQLVRDGLLALTTTGTDPVAVEAALREATAAPLRVLHLPEIDGSGAVRETLEARDGEIWLIRPDGHIAAIVGAAEELVAAVRRVLQVSAQRPNVAAPASAAPA